MNSLFDEIEEKDLLDGDCVKLDFQRQRKSMAKSNYGDLEWCTDITKHAYYEGGEFISVENKEKIIIKRSDFRLKFFLHRYKFISLPDCWYVEGTECFPDIQNYGSQGKDWKTNGASLFQGLTEEHNEIGWDGESCGFDEFEITERINQTRQRKLNRILKT